MDDLSVAVSKRLVELREANGISRRKLSRYVGADYASACRWESGMYCPSAFWLIRLADFYGCTVDEILGRTSNEHS